MDYCSSQVIYVTIAAIYFWVAPISIKFQYYCEIDPPSKYAVNWHVRMGGTLNGLAVL